jgi:hypothetical protein
LGRQPIAAGFDKLTQHPLSSAAYLPHKVADEIGRNPSVNFGEFDSDANAAYQCALMAAITGEHTYAVLSRGILNGWSTSLQRVSGADAVLMAGLGPFKFVNAAEILRHLGELNQPDITNCIAMLRRAILPAIIDFAPFANGNWDTAAVKTMLAIAVFCDDQALFERALLYYLHGDGDGCLTHYIYENGQCQESGRDQQHTQLGLAHMGDACQIAWNQGWDLYGAVDSRLLRGFEYTAAYNLGGKVEFQPDDDRTGRYRHSIISPPSALRPVYEQILAHYQVLCDLRTPAVQKAVEKIRPEGAAHGADHTGFGTLLYARTADDPEPAPRIVPPAALHADARGKAVELDWLQTRARASAVLERGGARVEVPARSGSYRDTNVVSGRQYRFQLTTQSPTAFTSAPVSIATSLPPGWTSSALGTPAVAGDVQFDGKVFKVCAAGKGLMQPIDEGHFVAAPAHVTRMKFRFIPQVASQFAAFGLAWRSGFAADAPSVALLVMPARGEPWTSGWHMVLLARESTRNVTILTHSQLAAPQVTYNRLVRPIWFRLESRGTSLEAAYSFDGSAWTLAGHSHNFKKGRLGLVAASGIPEVATRVRFELKFPNRDSL